MAAFFGGGRGAAGVDSVKSCQKLPSCLIGTKPDGSKTDLPLPKAEPISDGVIYFRSKKVTVQH